MAKKTAGQKGKIDWQRYRSQIFEKLNLEAEFESLGVEVTGSAGEDGWAPCRAVDREDLQPSAAVNFETGHYIDKGGLGLSLSFFDLAAHLKKFPSWKAARDHYAAIAGVQVNGQAHRDPAEHLVFKEWTSGTQNLVHLWIRHKPGVTLEAVRAFGGRIARYRDRYTVIAIPIWGQSSTDTDPCGWVLYNITGGMLPIYSKPRNGEKTKPEFVKMKTTCGSASGMAGEIDRLEGKTIILTEGPSDGMAAWAKIPADQRDGFAIVSNTGGSTETPPAFFLEAAKGAKEIIVTRDGDKAGQAGLSKWGKAISKANPSVRGWMPEGQIAQDHGADLRDKLNGGLTIGQVLDQAKPIEADNSSTEDSDKEGDDDEDPGTVKLLSDAICEEEHFAQDGGGKLYHYREGVFDERADEFIKLRVKQLLESWGATSEWTSRLAGEVIEYIRVGSHVLPAEPSTQYINLQNGVFDVKAGELLPHTPELLSTSQLPVAYDATADCPEIEKFVNDVFPDGATELAYEIGASAMLPNPSIDDAVLLTGDGGNGKSVYLRMLTRFLGRRNISALSLQRLESDRFSSVRLIGKLANICPDLPSEMLAGTSVFKAITSGEPLTGERKFGNSFEFYPCCRLIFSSNHPPRSPDASYAFFRRWKVIPFGRTFSGTEQIPSEVLDARLSTHTELSGFLNRCIKALKVIRANNHLSTPKSVQWAWEDFMATTDPLAVWLSKRVHQAPEEMIDKQVLRAAYNESCQRDGRPTLTAKAFSIAICRHIKNLQEGQRKIFGRVKWVYLGIGLLDEDQQQRSQHSRHSSYFNVACEEGSEEEDVYVEEQEQNRQDVVNVVNDVCDLNGRTCSRPDVISTRTFDGYINKHCRTCGGRLGCSKAEGVAS